VKIRIKGFVVANNGIQKIWGLQAGAALKTYNVPRQTLQRYLKKDEITIPKLGRKPEMGIEAEN
jgi:hypothetical protein